jgi:flagellar basal body-associated protein FliL
MKIWIQLAIVVALFCAAFAGILVIFGNAQVTTKETSRELAPQIERLKVNVDLVNQIPKIMENLDTTRLSAQRVTDAAKAAETALAKIEEDRKRLEELVAKLEERMQKPEQTTPTKPTTKGSKGLR